MTTSKAFTTQWSVWGVLGLAVAALLFSPVLVTAQQGDNAVYTTNNNVVPSLAWVDASAFCGSGGTGDCHGSGFDFCAILSTALGKLPAQGGVVDVRGVVHPLGGSQNCNSNPFANISQTNLSPITILLPASTIKMTGTWTLPNSTRIVGEGGFTILQGSSGCCTGAMIELGPPPGMSGCPSTPYSGISVEHLHLVGGSTGSYGGIDNECAQASSYVNDVGMDSLAGTGLTIGGGASNSGPYSNLTFTTVTGPSCSGGSSSCVDIEAQTQGLHGITCLGDDTTGGSQGHAGILVNASNNSIEDAHIETFWDGIEIGNSTSVVNNIFVSNVNANQSNNCSSGVKNAVHICGNYSSTTFGACLTYGPMSDVTILQSVNETPSETTSVQDDATGTSISGCRLTGCAKPITTAMYVLGEQDGGNTGEYSRFATSPANKSLYGNNSTVVPTWGVSNNVNPPSGACYTPGALYSYTAAVNGNHSIYVCTFSSGGGTNWTLIP
jgi:hypothetical protein